MAEETIESVVQPTVEAPVKPQKPIKVPERALEELEHIPTKNMTEKEIKKYVDYLRDVNVTLANQLKTLKDAFAGVQKQKDQTEADFAAYRAAANTQIAFCKDTLAQAFKAVHYMAPLEA
jgi:hypothetical protein